MVLFLNVPVRCVIVAANNMQSAEQAPVCIMIRHSVDQGSPVTLAAGRLVPCRWD